MVRFGVCVYRIYRATELLTVSRARTFIRKQVGKPYSLDFTKTHTSIDTPAWYCSELVFAGYYEGGMNLGITPDISTFDPDTTPILPYQITQCFLACPIHLNTQHVRIEIQSFQSSTWTFKVFNINGYPIDLCYNTKLCYLSDAKK